MGYATPADNGEATSNASGLGGILTQMRVMAQSALISSGTPKQSVGVQVRRHPEGWRAALPALVGDVQREFVVMSSGSSGCSDEQLIVTRENMRRMLNRGVAVRHVFAPKTLTRQSVKRYAEDVARCGAEVRIAGPDLRDTIVVDKQVALVWGQLDQVQEECLSIQDNILLDGLHKLFTSVWASSSEFASYQRWFGDDADGAVLDVALLLGSGMKDDTAAKRLDMSVRTYRRHVSVIMRRLDAKSRFQAGLRMAGLGLTADSAAKDRRNGSWR